MEGDETCRTQRRLPKCSAFVSWARWMRCSGWSRANNRSGSRGAHRRSKWSAHEHLAHLACYEQRFLERVQTILTTDRPEFRRYRAEEDPEWPQWQSLTPEEINERLTSRRRELADLVVPLSDPQLKRVGIHSIFRGVDAPRVGRVPSPSRGASRLHRDDARVASGGTQMRFVIRGKASRVAAGRATVSAHTTTGRSSDWTLRSSMAISIWTIATRALTGARSPRSRRRWPVVRARHGAHISGSSPIM